MGFLMAFREENMGNAKKDNQKINAGKFLLALCILTGVQVSYAAESNWNKLGSLDLIPCPKEISVLSDRTVLASENSAVKIISPDGKRFEVALALIEEKSVELGFGSVEKINYNNADLAEPRDNSVIILSIGDEFRKIPGFGDDDAIPSPPEKPQGYMIYFSPSQKMVILSGHDQQGMLYAAVTFAELLCRDEKKLCCETANISDWPDFKIRGGECGRLNNFKQAKIALDWFLKAKYNTVNISAKTIDRESWPLLRKINAYAADRGITTVYGTTWALGDSKTNKDDPRFDGCIKFNCCVTTTTEYYCWSRPELLKEHLQPLKEFVEATNAPSIYFHCIDSYEANWPERCEKCKALYGDDRAAADAAVINLITEEMRAVKPDIRLSFVTQPYGINMDLPGNERYRDYYTRLTGLISNDVLLNSTGYSHDMAKSWNAQVNQPIVRWQNGATFQIGRFFDSSPAFFKGTYFPERNDMAFLNEYYGYFDGEIMLLTAIEYMWNTESPGSVLLRDNRSVPPSKVGPYTRTSNLVGHKAINLGSSDGVKIEMQGEENMFDDINDLRPTCEQLLPRVCRKLYGSNLAPYMALYLRQGTTGWRTPGVAQGRAKTAAAAALELARARVALHILQAATDAAQTPAEKSTAERFYSRTVKLCAFYDSYGAVLAAEQSAKDADLAGLQNMIKLSSGKIAEGRKLLASAGIDKKEIDSWLSPVGDKLRAVERKLTLLSKQDSDPNGVKVAVYNPDNRGGRIACHDTLFLTLLQVKGFSVSNIDNLREETLKNYSIVVMPQVAKFGEGDEAIYRDNLRNFVSKQGGGVYLEHDNVGFYRGIIRASIFPEICKGGEKRKETVWVKAAALHQCIGDIEPETKLEHMYYDHITLLPGEKGTAVLNDEDGSPVVIAGSLGKGKVIFSGLVTLGRDGKEKDEADLVDKILLTNGLRWLTPSGNLAFNHSFETLTGNMPEGWTGTSAKSSDVAYDGNRSVCLEIAPDGKRHYAEIYSKPFDIIPGAEYFLDIWLRQQVGCRSLPMLVFWVDNAKRKEVSLQDLYSKDADGAEKYVNYFGFVKAPDIAGISTASFRLYLDWGVTDHRGRAPRHAWLDNVYVGLTK
jgi:hypothetical protein